MKEDIDDWMEVVGSSVDGYPYLNEKDYICRLRNYIAKRHGIVLEKDGVIAGVMAFSVRSSEDRAYRISGSPAAEQKGRTL